MLRVMLNTTQSTCLFLLMIFFQSTTTFAFPADTTSCFLFIIIFFELLLPPGLFKAKCPCLPLPSLFSFIN